MLLLRAIAAWDRQRARGFLRRRSQIEAREPCSPHVRLASVSLGTGGRLELGAGFATERRAGANVIRVGAGARVSLGDRVWLRTDYGTNYLTAFDGASIAVGPDGLINGAMIHAKSAITIGSDFRMGFGARVLDADLHDLDADTRERIAPVRIGDRVWLASDAVVLRGVTIGDDVVVAAGAIVTRDLPSRCVAAGAPAAPIRSIGSRVGCR